VLPNAVAYLYLSAQLAGVAGVSSFVVRLS
jgi:hypothetical protein